MDLNGLPDLFVSFLSYKLNIQGCSPLTVKEYLIDLRCFFRHVISEREKIPEKSADIMKVTPEFADSVTVDEVYKYLLYLAAATQKKPTTRSRKLSTIRAFYKFHTAKSHMLKNNPAIDVDPPKKQQKLPIVMTFEEARALLSSFDKSDLCYRRNYVIVLIFLNCGIRLSELVGLNISDIDSNLERFTVHGKGGKDRALYFNSACREALLEYLLVRQQIGTPHGHAIKDSDALFLSTNGKRISPKTVQWMVKRQFELCGLGNRGYSVHKLRHTAATLMYNEGGVDIMMLKEILGHSQLSTTQIYTHVERENMRIALENNPLNEGHGHRSGRQIKRSGAKFKRMDVRDIEKLIMDEYRRIKTEGVFDFGNNKSFNHSV